MREALRPTPRIGRPGHPGETHRSPDERPRHRYPPNQRLHGQHRAGIEHRMQPGASAAGGLFDDGLFLRAAGVVDPELEHEAVELSLRQRIGSLLLDRILCRQDKKRIGQPVGGAGRGDLMLLHCLEQGRLCFRRGAVDLVGQHHVGKDGALHETKGSLAGGEVFLDDVRPGDVARHQVRGELHPVERQIQRLGHSLDHERLGQPGNSDQQRVPAG
jgi:hypothetical protein